MLEARRRAPNLETQQQRLQQQQQKPSAQPQPRAPRQRQSWGVLPLLGVLATILLVLRLGVKVATVLNQHTDQATAGTGISVFTAEELSKFGGSDGTPIYIAILGDVFDVSSKPEFYSKGNGYHHFAAADGTRAFVTGEFEGPPRDDIGDLSPEEIHAIVGWRKFYFETYPHKGRLTGTYYTPDGQPTAKLTWVEAQGVEGERIKAEKEKEVQQYVSCSIRYTPVEGGQVSCEEGHYPRKLFDGMDKGSSSWRCVCMEDIGWSDLLQIYPGCAPDARVCQTSPPEEQED